ncbi:MAG: shikimate kinase [Acidimicrobiia bacterium]
MNPDLVLLVGQMGVGKTTVGRLVADHLALPFSDCDAQIEEITGRTSREIARSDGVPALHALELAVLLSALEHAPAVIAAAASVVDSRAGRDAIGKATCVWIDRVPDVTARPGEDHRRSVDADEHLERRRPDYQGLADLVLTGPGTADEYAKRVVEFLGDNS